MTRLVSFIAGTSIGIFVAQNYDIPDIKKIGNRVIEYIKSLEKK